jgi:hypothetical protein
MTDLEADRSEAAGIPTRAGLDCTAGLLLEGYPFLADCRRRWETVPLAGGRAVELRLLGERAVCVGGPEGVRLFYDPERFRRRDAVPRPLAGTLFGRGRSTCWTARPTGTARRCSCRCWMRRPPARSLVRGLRRPGPAPASALAGPAGPRPRCRPRGRVGGVRAMLGARVDRSFSWRGHRFPEGRLVLLDALPRRPAGPVRLRAHGGGDPATGHRCAGEQVAVELLKGAVRVLARLRYALPDPPPTCVRRPDRSR